MSVALRDLLYGIAVADAIGNPLEFSSSVTGEQFDSSLRASSLRISDDTQMNLFLAEALIMGKTSEEAYLRWYATQRPNMEGVHNDHRGLLAFRGLYCQESPGLTCMASCHSLLHGGEVANESKGNGTAMRCAPIAFYGLANQLTLNAAVARARRDAEVTHKHPTAGDASAFLVDIYWSLATGQTPWDAIQGASERLKADRPTSEIFNIQIPLNEASYGLASRCYGGWVAEEAVALALGALLLGDDYLSIVKRATMINGDSDTVAAIAGALAVFAGHRVPDALPLKLNALDSIDWLVCRYTAAGCSIWAAI